MKVKHLLFMLVVFGIIFAGCEGKKTETNEAMVVFTSILPQKYFVEKIGGDRVRVEVMVGPGKSPATYEPSPQQIIALGNAKILFTIGVPFEQAFLPSIESTLPSLRLVDTSAGIEKRHLDAHSHEEDEHGEDDDGVPDPHIWLSPELVKIQARNIYQAFVSVDPAGKEVYESGYSSFIQELEEVDEELKTALAPFKGSTIFVYHPALGYFADRYGLKQVAIETGGKEPAPSMLEEIIEHAKNEKVKIVFVQPEFSQSSARSIAEAIGGVVLNLNPLNPDYINNLKSISSEIERAVR